MKTAGFGAPDSAAGSDSALEKSRARSRATARVGGRPTGGVLGSKKWVGSGRSQSQLSHGPAAVSAHRCPHVRCCRWPLHLHACRPWRTRPTAAATRTATFPRVQSQAENTPIAPVIAVGYGGHVTASVIRLTALVEVVES